MRSVSGTKISPKIAEAAGAHHRLRLSNYEPRGLLTRLSRNQGGREVRVSGSSQGTTQKRPRVTVAAALIGEIRAPNRTPHERAEVASRARRRARVLLDTNDHEVRSRPSSGERGIPALVASSTTARICAAPSGVSSGCARQRTPNLMIYAVCRSSDSCCAETAIRKAPPVPLMSPVVGRGTKPLRSALLRSNRTVGIRAAGRRLISAFQYDLTRLSQTPVSPQAIHLRRSDRSAEIRRRASFDRL